MTLREQIRADLKNSMKAKDEARTSALRVILGEFARQPNKELSDLEVQAIVKKLVKSEEEMIAQSHGEETDFLRILRNYLPQQVDEAAIRSWIEANIDFSQFKNKMQAMKPIMTHFGGAADGNLVKDILNSL